MNEIQSNNLKQLVRFYGNDIDIKYLTRLINDLYKERLTDIYPFPFIPLEPFHFITNSVTKLINYYSLMELSIRTGYISNKLPRSFEKQIQRVIRIIYSYEMLYPHYINNFLTSLYDRINKPNKKNQEFVCEFKPSFFEFLSLFNLVWDNKALNVLLIYIKNDKNILGSLIEVLKIKKKYKGTNSDITLVIALFKFLDFLLNFDNFLKEIDKTDKIIIDYKKFYNYYFKDEKLLQFLKNFVKEATYLNNDTKIEYEIEKDEQSYFKKIESSVERLWSNDFNLMNTE